MRNYIILNGVNSNTINGLLISELPPITKPKIRTQTEEIDGRDGDIITDLGYSAYDKTIEIGLYGSFDINEVISYFNTSGTVVFSNEADKYYNYQIIAQIDYERLIRFRKAKVKLHCQPFKYPLNEQPVSVTVTTTTAEDTSHDLTDVAEANLSMIPKGNTTQDISRNLFKTNGNITYGGVTTTVNNDDSLTMSGTPTNDLIALQPNTSASIPTGTYTFSIQEALPFSIYFMFTVAGGMTSSTINAGQTSVTFTLTKAVTQYRLWVSGVTTGTAVNKTIKVQIEEGSSATKWIPNGVPSPTNPSEVKTVTGYNTISVVNKNLFKLYTKNSSITANGVEYSIDDDGNIKMNGTSTANTWLTIVSDFKNGVSFETTPVFTLNKSETYTLSRNYISGSASALPVVYVSVDYRGGSDETQVDITDNQNKQITGCTGLYRAWIRVTPNQTYSNYTFNVQLERGSTKTTYEESKAQNYPINLGTLELCKIGNYQDYIYKQAGKFYKHSEIGKLTVDSSSNVASVSDTNATATTTSKNGTYVIFTNGASNNTMLFPIAKYEHKSNITNNQTAQDNLSDNSFCIRQGTNDRIYFKNSAYTGKTGNEIKEIITGLSVYYIRTTPIEEEITNTNLIDQLNNISNAYSYKGDTHINSTANKEHPILSVTTYSTNDTTVTNEGNYFSRPVITLTGSGNIGLYINGIQELQIDLSTSNQITIDSDNMEAYNGSILLNRQVTGDYSNVIFNSGTNTIEFTGGVTSYSVSNYSRWL